MTAATQEIAQKPITFIAVGIQGVGPEASGQNQGGVIRLVDKPIISVMNPATGQRESKPGKAVEFRQGRFTTADPDVIEFLREHPKNGNNTGGTDVMFVEQGNEPGRPKPDLEDVMREVADAQLRLDVPTIAARREAELATHRRAEVLILCRTALETLTNHGDEDAREALEADPETAATPA